MLKDRQYSLIYVVGVALSMAFVMAFLMFMLMSVSGIYPGSTAAVCWFSPMLFWMMRKASRGWVPW